MAASAKRAVGTYMWAIRRALKLSCTQRASSCAGRQRVLFSSYTQTAASRAGRQSARFSSATNFTGEVDEINSKFAEAREEIEMALESKETVYFDEEARTARDAVNLVLDKYQALLDKLTDADKGSLQRAMGLKMEQLRAELKQLDP